jgi:hypothetical protein
VLLFGRGVSLDFAVLAPCVIFERAPQGVADGDMGIFMRVVVGRAAANEEFVPRQSDIARARLAYQRSRRVSRFGNYPVRACPIGWWEVGAAWAAASLSMGALKRGRFTITESLSPLEKQPLAVCRNQVRIAGPTIRWRGHEWPPRMASGGPVTIPRAAGNGEGFRTPAIACGGSWRGPACENRPCTNPRAARTASMGI